MTGEQAAELVLEGEHPSQELVVGRRRQRRRGGDELTDGRLVVLELGQGLGAQRLEQRARHPQ